MVLSTFARLQRLARVGPAGLGAQLHQGCCQSALLRHWLVFTFLSPGQQLAGRVPSVHCAVYIMLVCKATVPTTRIRTGATSCCGKGLTPESYCMCGLYRHVILMLACQTYIAHAAASLSMMLACVLNTLQSSQLPRARVTTSPWLYSYTSAHGLD